MKTFLTIIFGFISTICFGQTKLCVIGILDNSNSKYDANYFYSIIDNFNPDVILYECDSIFFTDNFHFDTIVCPTIFSSVETVAIDSYQHDHQVKVRPFDIEGRNKFYTDNNYFEKETSMFNDIGLALSENKIAPENLSNFDILWSVLSLYKINKYTLEEINSRVFQDFTEYKHAIVHDLLIDIISKNDALLSWKDYAILRKEYWDKRNNAMVVNISNFIKEFDGKRILVVTGAEHKFFIENYFTKPEFESLSIIDYWGLKE